MSNHQRSPVLRRLPVLLLGLLVLVAAAAPAAAAPPMQAPRVQLGEWLLDEVADWQAGAVSGLLVTNNAGGELRLAEDQTTGVFLSTPFETKFPFNSAGITWRAELPQGASVAFELREHRPVTETAELARDANWGQWQRVTASDARSQKDDGAFATPDVLTFPGGSGYLQLRITFTSSTPRASAILSSASVSYLDSTLGVPAGPGLPRAPIFAGRDVLTPRPTLVLRSTWSSHVGTPTPERALPRGIIIHQIDKPAGIGDATSLLRALAVYQTEVLGWDDLAYHYAIDDNGVLYEGRLGGPTSLVPRLAGGGIAVHVALIGSTQSAPGEAAQGALVSLLAWLGQVYNISPTGEHAVNAAGQRVVRPNIAGHNDVAPEAPDPARPLRELLPQLRTRADRSTIRARWYFAEGNIRDYSQRFAIFNPTASQAEATVTLWRTDASPPSAVARIITVPANSRADLVVNDLIGSGVLSATASLPAIVESSAPIVVERSMGLNTDIDGGPGIDRLSRIWYFAEGSTAGTNRTYLVLFNPQPTATSAVITYIKGDGTTAEKQEQIPAQQRLVVTVGDQLAGAEFGVRVSASQPIAVERTMRFGADGGGLHTGRGISTLANRWYFAEGTTEAPFQMQLLLLNPNEQTANVTVTFLKPGERDGTTEEVRRYAIPPTTRLAVNANDVVPNLGIATLVDSDRPLAAERALYFRDGAAGTISAGAIAPAYTWRFAEGRSRDATYFLCLGNPTQQPALVTVSFVFGDGAPSTQQITVPANTRYTIAVHQIYPDEDAIAATVRSTVPIVAERSFFPGGGARGGSTSLGVPGE